MASGVIYAAAMPFEPTDISFQGQVPGTTVLSYVVSRDGEPVGTVNVPGAPALVNQGEDVREWIARRLNEVEESVGGEGLNEALDAVLEL
jgi:hypothetical protein